MTIQELMSDANLFRQCKDYVRAQLKKELEDDLLKQSIRRAEAEAKISVLQGNKKQ